MIDFHAHILPKMDDGSKSVDESMAMLSSLGEQGVQTVIATPHFYADNESVDGFIERRKASFDLLKERSPNTPEIVLGAEVRFYDGISHLSDLKKLRIEGSKLLLLEMPFSQWTEGSVKEVIDIAGRGKITLVLAHIDRYLPFLKNGVLSRLLNNGILLQANTSFLIGRFSRSKAIKMIKNNRIHFIGSDCHNMTDRKPNPAKAFSIIQKRLGDAFASDFINYGNDLFSQNQVI